MKTSLAIQRQGVRADPEEYEAYEPAWIPGNQPVQVPGRRFYGYRYPYIVPRYPFYAYEPQPPPAEAPQEDADSPIPGTDLTKSQLSEKVMSQITQNKAALSQEHDEEKLLKKRETMEENTLKSSLKSVTFDQDQVKTELEAEYESGELDFGDSGRGSADDLYLSDIEGGNRNKRCWCGDE